MRSAGNALPGLQSVRPADDAAGISGHRGRKGTAPLEGIVSKKLGSRYEFGRSSLWLKTINPSAPALLRLEQEDWRG